MKIGGYDIEIVISGYPGKSVCHGGLGWSSVTLLEGRGRTALVDTGSFGMRQILHERFEALGRDPACVTDVLLTHCHHDHSINWTMFPNANVAIGRVELDWSLTVPWGMGPVPEIYVRELARMDRVHRIEEGDEVLPEVTAHLAPGHTPGCLVYRLRGDSHDLIFTGDAAKNRTELISRSADKTDDEKVSAASIERIWRMWRAKAGSIVIPGHDLPMTQQDGATAYIGERQARIKAWFADDLEQVTIYDLTNR